MLCQRCRGLLVRETFGDLSAETDRLCSATRCINCGCVEDAVVRANRFRHSVGNRSVPRGMVRKGDVVCIKIRPEAYASISMSGRAPIECSSHNSPQRGGPRGTRALHHHVPN